MSAGRLLRALFGGLALGLGLALLLIQHGRIALGTSAPVVIVVVVVVVRLVIAAVGAAMGPDRAGAERAGE